MRNERPGRVALRSVAPGVAVAGWIVAAAAGGWGGPAQAQPRPAAPMADPPLRWAAPLTVEPSKPFQQLNLSPEAYRHSQSSQLADLRLVDAAGQRVPFAWLPQAPAEARERLQPATLYPLPEGAATDRLPASIDLTLEQGRITVRQRGGATTAAPARSGGWPIDTEPAATAPRAGGRMVASAAATPPARRPGALLLQWPEGAAFSVGYALETSDDLRQWRPAGGGQLVALAAGGSVLAQPRVPLDERSARFVRLRWLEPAQAPRLTGARAVFDETQAVAIEPPVELRLQATPADRALELDLGGTLPLQQLDLALAAGTQVVPLRVLQRQRSDQPWQELARGVVYRIERDGAVHRSPPLALVAEARWLRLEPDERAAALQAATPVLLRLRPQPLVFAAQGTPPYELRIGAANAAPGALAIETLVPLLDQERPRFGRARLGALVERPEALQQQRQAAEQAAWRPRLLWGVLLVGVAGLGWMVWRLARQMSTTPPQAQG